MAVTVCHDPRCGKSRRTPELLRERGLEPEIVEYLKAPPGPATLDDLPRRLGLEPRQPMRRKEPIYGEPAWTTRPWTAPP